MLKGHHGLWMVLPNQGALQWNVQGRRSGPVPNSIDKKHHLAEKQDDVATPLEIDLAPVRLMIGTVGLAVDPARADSRRMS